MQSHLKKLPTSNNVLGANGGAHGDNGVSFYSHSSFNDTTMMDTSGVVPISGVSGANATLTPPNDKLIHVSQCANDKCPL